MKTISQLEDPKICRVIKNGSFHFDDLVNARCIFHLQLFIIDTCKTIKTNWIT